MDSVKKNVGIVLGGTSTEELNFNRANENGVCLPHTSMNKLEVTSISALITYRAYELKIGTDTVECALHTEFRDWQSRADSYDAVVRWLVDFGGVN